MTTTKRMTSAAGVVGNRYTSDVVLPAQFHDLWSGTSDRSGELTLALAVLERAIDDLARYRATGTDKHRLLHRQARCWVASDDRRWPYSFLNVCDMLNLSSGRMRSRLLADGPTVVLDRRASGGDVVAAVR